MNQNKTSYIHGCLMGIVIGLGVGVSLRASTLPLGDSRTSSSNVTIGGQANEQVSQDQENMISISGVNKMDNKTSHLDFLGTVVLQHNIAVKKNNIGSSYVMLLESSNGGGSLIDARGNVMIWSLSKKGTINIDLSPIYNRKDELTVRVRNGNNYRGLYP